jgi:hypothetical protein
VLSVSIAAAAADIERTGGPYVPTPQIVVDRMLQFGAVGPDDYVMDLGCGDGVIVLTAAKDLKASGMGVDIDPALVNYANGEAQRLGIAGRAKFAVQDVFKADLSRASVITLYLLPEMMTNLKAKIFLEARPGTRVVSHDYEFGDWQPDEFVVFDVPEKAQINGEPKATVLLWVVPARVGGRWSLAIEGGERYDVTWRQSFQAVEGEVNGSRGALPLRGATLRGRDFEFVLGGPGARQTFAGRVDDDRMEGTVELAGGKRAKWTAVRAGT